MGRYKEFLGWLSARGGEAEVDRDALEAAGLLKAAKHLRTIVCDLRRAGRLEVLGRERYGPRGRVRYRVRLVSSGKEAHMRAVPAAVEMPAASGTEPLARAGTVEPGKIGLRLVIRRGVLDELELVFVGADGRRASASLPADGQGELVKILRRYEEDGRKLVEAAVRYQEAVSRVEEVRAEFTRLQEEMASLRLRVEALGRVVDRLVEERQRPVRPRPSPERVAREIFGG